MRTILVTGGAGFIGSCLVRLTVAQGDTRVVNLDKLTYAGNLDSLESVADQPHYVFVQGDIGNGPLVSELLATHRPQAIVNLAAESHVDRSIDGPAAFVETNVVGTFRLLEAARRVLGSTSAGGGRVVPLRACLDRRGLRLAGTAGCIHGGHSLCPEFALFRLEGGLRSLRACLSPHLRTARADHELLEQLRSFPVSREADPVDDSQRPGGKTAAGLRGRTECARLVVCRGSRAGPC